MAKLLSIDGSQGEGGGQILRTSMALSCITQTPIHISNIRAKRKKPGLLRQHLTSVQALQTISKGRLHGDTLGSGELTFTPGPITHGEYTFSVGSAGSTILVFQTVLWPLLMTPGRSRLTFMGGTHNPLAPPFDFLDQVFLPLIRRMGAHVTAKLENHGFFPAGGGCFFVELEGGQPLAPLILLERGPVRQINADVFLAHLPQNIGNRELNVVRQKFELKRNCLHTHQVTSAGPGNVLLITIESENCTEQFAGFGAKGVVAEKLAEEVSAEALEYVAAEVPVGSYLADQLLLPLALGNGGSFRSLPLTLHSETNTAVIQQFLPRAIEVTPQGPTAVRIDIGS